MDSTTDNYETKLQKRKPKLPAYHELDGYILPLFLSLDTVKSAFAYQPRPDDLFIVTYPKCGTTWVQYIVGCIFRQGIPFQTAIEFMTQTPYLEGGGTEALLAMRRPGAIKMHTPYHLTPKSLEAKYIYVARNPKDCCVSFYHHTENVPGFEFEGGEFDDFFELFIEGKVNSGDYFDNLLSWYEHRNDPNVLFITYEQLKKDTETYVMKIAEFIGPQYKKALETDPQMLKDVIHHSSFDFMKKHISDQFSKLKHIPKHDITNNPDIPSSLKKSLAPEGVFMNRQKIIIRIRKGIVGDWRNYFSPSQNARLMKKFRERTMGTDIPDLWKDCM